MKTIIEEGIWNIKERQPLRRVVFEFDGNKITRSLFILGDSERKNSKIDIIDYFVVELSKIKHLSPLALGKFLKKELSECFDKNVDNEIKFFTNPIITKK